jgi:hypothetical protein
VPIEPGGQGDEPSRSELAIERQALRNDWPIPPAVKRTILQRLIDYLDREHDEGRTCSDRQVVMAARTLGMFCQLGLDQQKLDLVERKIEGRQSARSLVELVGEAEARALEIDRMRDEGAAGGAAGPVP